MESKQRHQRENNVAGKKKTKCSHLPLQKHTEERPVCEVRRMKRWREEREGKGAGVIGGSFKMKLKPPFFFSVIMKSYHLNQICRMESGLVGWVNRWGSLIKHRRRSYARGAAQTSINYYLIIKPRAINKNKRGHSWSIYGNSPGTRRREKGIWCDK